MSAERLTALRRALGVSVNDMADALGLSGDNAGDRVREMERGVRAVSGPLLKLLAYMEQAVEIDEDAGDADLMMRAIPRWLDCSDLEDYEGDDHVEIVLHTRWPRFFALFVDELPVDSEQAMDDAGIAYRRLPDAAGLGWMVALFIDQPITDPARLLDECAVLKTAQALRDLESE